MAGGGAEFLAGPWKKGEKGRQSRRRGRLPRWPGREREEKARREVLPKKGRCRFY